MNEDYAKSFEKKDTTFPRLLERSTISREYKKFGTQEDYN